MFKFSVAKHKIFPISNPSIPGKPNEILDEDEIEYLFGRTSLANKVSTFIIIHFYSNKVAGHDLKSLVSLWTCKIPGFSYPLSTYLS